MIYFDCKLLKKIQYSARTCRLALQFAVPLGLQFAVPLGLQFEVPLGLQFAVPLGLQFAVPLGLAHFLTYKVTSKDAT